MHPLTILALVVLGALEVVAFYYLWRTNRRLDALDEELRFEIVVLRSELDEACRAMDRRLNELAEEIEERIRSADPLLAESIGIRGLLGDLPAVNDGVQCLRTPGGTSKRMRRSDHRQ